ncbi:MAG: hypothetical protein WCO35_01985 [Candidatus Nomurabacteria bacterium]
MSALIYLIIAILFFISAFSIVYFRMVYLSGHPDEYDKSYDGHELFLNRLFATVRYYVRRLYVYIKLAYSYILHIWVIIIDKIRNVSDRLYMKSRDEFVKEVVKDKKAVPHFWSHLKKYKREKDEENRIDDNSINTLIK